MNKFLNFAKTFALITGIFFLASCSNKQEEIMDNKIQSIIDTLSGIDLFIDRDSVQYEYLFKRLEKLKGEDGTCQLGTKKYDVYIVGKSGDIESDGKTTLFISYAFVLKDNISPYLIVTMVGDTKSGKGKFLDGIHIEKSNKQFVRTAIIGNFAITLIGVDSFTAVLSVENKDDKEFAYVNEEIDENGGRISFAYADKRTIKVYINQPLYLYEKGDNEQLTKKVSIDKLSDIFPDIDNY